MKRIKTFENFANDNLEISQGEGRYKILLKHLSALEKNWQTAPTEAAKAEYMKDIRSTRSEIKSIEQKGNTIFRKTESVGDYEPSSININIDETELEDSDRPIGKLKQKPGKIIIETPSKTDAYNAKMRLGGEVIQDPKFSDKQTHFVKPTK